MKTNGSIEKTSSIIVGIMVAAQVIMCLTVLLPAFVYFKALVRGQVQLGSGFAPFAVYLVTLVCYIIILFFVVKVFKAVKREETPFVPQNVKRLKLIAVLAGGLSIVRIVGSLVLPTWFLPGGFITIGGESLIGFDFSALMLGLNSSARVIDLSSIVLGVIALMVYGMAAFTQHGVALQTQADETL